MMSRLIRPFLLVAFTMTFVGACSRDFVSQTQNEPPIIGGTTDTTHTAVVALEYQGEEFCSGTLIAPRVVVSAGHCIKETGFTASDITVFFGTKVGGTGTSVKASGWKAHPSYYVKSNGIPMYDVSVVTLAEDAPVAPMAWQSTTMGDIVGKTVTFVGYGVTNASTQTGNDTRRQVNGVISGQDTNFIYHGNGKTGTCQGDSGGPTLLDQNGTLTVIAVTSYGDYSCVDEGGNTRVDTFASFISQFIQSCTPNCSGKQCGADGCGGTCGTCSSGTCNASGQCVTSTSCAHAICSTGALLDSTCDPCVTKICASDSYCCNNSWDSYCVKEVASICGQTCGTTPAACTHSVCTSGTKLKSGCSDCVTAICAADSYCCSTKWDSQCVSEVAQYCTESC